MTPTADFWQKHKMRLRSYIAKQVRERAAVDDRSMQSRCRQNIPCSAEQIPAGSGHGSHAADLERRSVRGNEIAEKTTGRMATEVVGRPCRNELLGHPDKEDRAWCGRKSRPLYRAKP